MPTQTARRNTVQPKLPAALRVCALRLILTMFNGFFSHPPTKNRSHFSDSCEVHSTTFVLVVPSHPVPQLFSLSVFSGDFRIYPTKS